VGFIVHREPARREAADLAALAAFRAELYSVFGNWADALFETVDALAGTARPVRSVAELMFDSACRRGWGSLYQALEDGEVVVEQARDVLARWVRPAGSGDGGTLMFAVDASTFPRPGTRHVPDVGMQYDAKLDRPGAGSPAVPGWSFQWVAQVGLRGGPLVEPPAGPSGSSAAPPPAVPFALQSLPSPAAASFVPPLPSSFVAPLSTTVALAVGLFGGYAAIRTAAHIAKRKAA